MRNRHSAISAVSVVGLLLLAVGAPVTVDAGLSGASTPATTTTTTTQPLTAPGTLLGEGGSFAQPIVDKLLTDSANQLAPISGAYFLSTVTQGCEDFSTGNDDFAVSEFPLTSAEASAAAKNKRAYAYVPFAISSVAIGAIVERQTSTVLTPTTLHKDIELSVPQLADVFTNAVTTWTSPTLAAPGGAGYTLDTASNAITPRFLVDPAASTYALISLILSNPSAKASWDAWLKAQSYPEGPATETWPTSQGVSGGDYALASTLVPLDEQIQPPVALSNPEDWGQGDIAPLPIDWTGPPWNIPPVAIQNPTGAYVLPTVAATTAALSHATMDPSTNLVTFGTSTTDAAAYPMVVASYLVVPTTGLLAAKARALAALIRFAVGSQGQADVESFGAAPITPVLVAADLKVADTVAAEGATGTTGTTTTTSTTIPATGTTTTSTTIPANGTTTTSTTIPANGTTTTSTTSPANGTTTTSTTTTSTIPANGTTTTSTTTTSTIPTTGTTTTSTTIPATGTTTTSTTTTSTIPATGTTTTSTTTPTTSTTTTFPRSGKGNSGTKSKTTTSSTTPPATTLRSATTTTIRRMTTATTTAVRDVGGTRSSGGNGRSSGGQLAFTGMSTGPILATGSSLLFFGAFAERRLRRLRRHGRKLPRAGSKS